MNGTSDHSMTYGVAPSSFPIGSGIVLSGAAMMAVGACGPWVSGRLFGATHGLDLGGDGWLVVGAAALALLPLLMPLPPSSLKGIWVLVFAAVGGYVCWAHYQEASVDGFEVVWGLEVAATGSALVALGGIRLLRPGP